MNNLKAAIIAMEKRGAPILGMTFEENGVEKEFDIQMNTRVARFGSDSRTSNTLNTDGGELHFLVVDRNKAKKLREFKPEMSAEEAAENSSRSFPVSGIYSLRYMGVEIATS